MYTRSFYKEEGGILVPENYDGVALREERGDSVAEEKAELTESTRLGESEAAFSPLLGRSSLINSLPFLKSFNFGIEELLIIGVAAFLFFTKDGDKECAIMLLILLFIS